MKRRWNYINKIVKNGLKAVVFFLAFDSVSAQDLTGVSLSNFGGVHRATLNPSSLAGSPYKWQFNVGTINSTINNRYFSYLGRNSVLFPALASTSSKELYGRSRTMGSITNEGPIFLESDVRMPSLHLAFGDKHGISVQVRSRGFVQGNGIPKAVQGVYTNRLDIPTVVGESGEWGDFHLKQHSFSDIAVAYGRELFRTPNHRLSVGITLKKIVGGRTSYIKGNIENYELNTLANSENELVVHNFNYEGGVTNPVEKGGFFQTFNKDKYGQGWGTDLGVTYELGNVFQSDDQAASSASYIVRVAASVTDLGSLHYKTKSSNQFNGHASSWRLEQAELEGIANFGPEGVASHLGKQNEQKLEGTGMLPAMFNYDVDLQVFKSFFVNVSGGKNLVTSPDIPLDMTKYNYVSISPRWEYEDADYAIPITFIDGKEKVAIGLSGRVGPVQAGFSNFLGMIGKGDSRSTYAYVGLSFYHFKSRDYRKKVKWKTKW